MDISDYPTTIRDNAVGYHDGRVYSFGGSLRGEGGTPASYVYDPAAKTWTRLADMPDARQKPASAFVDGKFYVVTGWGQDGTPAARTLVYDPDADAWTRLPNSRNALYRGATACGLYKIGGANGPRVTPFGEVLPTLDDCDPAGTAAPWLSADPGHGTLAPGRSVRVTLTLDARELAEPGTYEARLTVNEDTPYPAPAIGVTLKAEAPWHWARLSGEVGSKACDGKVSPLPGATVTLRRGRDSWTATTDAQGRYRLWLPDGLLKQEVQVSADGHRTASFDVRLLPHTQVRRDATLPRTDC
ncbi:kelch repeat-containing protein [Nonomuraea sp. NPDC048892]|uniref:kelch repeat-containing protein n=1 Tax=Nonomuraea sp. NPDC048892 TaxID=3154624 RepID=UPI0033E9D785